MFLNKAHIPEDSLNDSVLISLKEKILRKCDGSPQAIVILAGLLSTRNLTEWSSVIEHAFLEENILASSYEDLPPQIKPCFLYLGLFPRAFQISVRRLLHLWLAEGLLDWWHPCLSKKWPLKILQRNTSRANQQRPDWSGKTEIRWKPKNLSSARYSIGLLSKSGGFKTFPCPQHHRLYIRRTSQVQCSATSRICRYQELPFIWSLHTISTFLYIF